MDAKVNAFNARLRPSEGTDALAVYLAAVTRALGGRSDADLARFLSVPPSTVGSWKRRGYVPPDRLDWFAESLVPLIAGRWMELPQVSKTARAAVLDLIVRTGGNPLNADRFIITTTAQALGGLLALAELLAALEGIPPQALSSDGVRQVADLLEGSMPQFRQGAGLLAA